MATVAGGVPRTLNFTNGLSLQVTAVWREAGLIIQRLAVDGVALDLIHTPGHRPNHCCMLVGGLVLVSDLFLAAKVVRVIDWDNEAVVRSLAKMSEIIGGENIRVVCPGYVPALAPAAAIATLAVMAARPLQAIAELNPGRACWLADFAALTVGLAATAALRTPGRIFRWP